MPQQLTERLQALLGSSYRLDRELTGGGMSRVFVANEPALKRNVVVKVLPPDLVTSSSVERFEREIEVTAQLQHPHILPVITAGGEGDLYYYITPYISGESLKDRLTKDEKLPFDEALRLIGELLGAVAFAHARGVVHRDIKPGNVLLSEGHAILADFGISRALAGPDDGQVTMSGTLIGTPAYMAPENPRDEKADLYAVAVVAIEMLTGKRPKVKGDAKRVTEEFAAIGEKGVARRAKAVGEVLARATSMEAEQRYQSAKELRDAVAAAGAQRAAGRALALVSAAVIVVGALIAPRVYREFKPLPSGYVDRVAVLPVNSVLASGADVALADSITAALHEALRSWRGVREVVISDINAISPSGEGADLARRLSRREEPTSVLAARLSNAGTNRTLTYRVVAPDGQTLRTGSINVDSVGIRVAAWQLANNAIRVGERAPWLAAKSYPRVDVTAWRMIDSADLLVRAGDVPAAESIARKAVLADSAEAMARFQAAELLTWMDDSARGPEIALSWEAALSRRSTLSPTQRARMFAWSSMLAKDFPVACAVFDSLTTTVVEAHAAWIGLGDCRYRDRAVVRRGDAPAFRTGWNGAATAFERAIATWPGIAPDFVYRRLAAALPTQTNRARGGEGVGTGEAFVALPTIVEDTLAYRPSPGSRLLTADSRTAEALRRDASRLRIAIQRWLIERPQRPEAHLFHAHLLESLGVLEGPATGERSALSEAREATRLSSVGLEQVRARSLTIRVLLKLRRWTDARIEADSAIASFDERDPERAIVVAPIAALRGDAERLRRAQRVAGAMPRRVPLGRDGKPIDIPPVLLQLQADALAGALLGDCSESSRSRLRDLELQIEALTSTPERRRVIRSAIVVPALEMLATCMGYHGLDDLPETATIWRAERAMAVGDTAGAVALVQPPMISEANPRRFESTDFALRAAWIELAARDSARALARVERALAALPTASPLLIERDFEAAALVRLMRLAADLYGSRDGRDSFNALRWLAAADTLTRR